MYDPEVEDEQIEGFRQFEMDPLQSSISPDGQWVTVVMTKFGFHVEETRGYRKVQFWESFNIPYGNEIKVALPLVIDPREEQPLDTITIDEMAQAVYAAKRLDAKVKKLEEDETNG